MDRSVFERYYDVVTDVCVDFYGKRGVSEVLDALLAIPGLPMHCPVHHYIVPAALLTVCRARQGRTEASLRADLAEALERAREVPGGFCGYSGCCGAAVGVGIFWSIVTGSTPMSEASWGVLQRATAETLLRMSEFGGPRCCKRSSFIAIEEAARQVKALLKIDLGVRDRIECRHSGNNEDCIEDRCPFFSAEPADR